MSLELPISNNDCLIINEIVDLKDNEKFVENFYKNLKNNTQDFQITINDIKYKVCINELIYRNIENLIVNIFKFKQLKNLKNLSMKNQKNKKN
ncbi:MAG: hypothetical protein CM15mP72_6810 [Pelagibacteraceae bacterium]|nr:MAG: hypothetical protein CM15mP72_6810 [Pelagibacteraceae bacterium]